MLPLHLKICVGSRKNILAYDSLFIIYIIFFERGVVMCPICLWGDGCTSRDQAGFVCLLVSFGANLGTQGVERGEKTA